MKFSPGWKGSGLRSLNSQAQGLFCAWVVSVTLVLTVWQSVSLVKEDSFRLPTSVKTVYVFTPWVSSLPCWSSNKHTKDAQPPWQPFIHSCIHSFTPQILESLQWDQYNCSSKESAGKKNIIIIPREPIFCKEMPFITITLEGDVIILTIPRVKEEVGWHS